jgi:tetratricopeptide (TPR) repeat protein
MHKAWGGGELQLFLAQQAFFTKVLFSAKLSLAMFFIFGTLFSKSIFAMFRFLELFVFSFFLLLAACKQVDLSSDKIPPLLNNSQKTTAQQIALLNEIIAEDPEVAAYYYRRAVLYVEAKNYIKAFQDINQTLKLRGDKSNYFFLQALVLEALKNYPEALKSAEIAEKKGLKQVDLYMLLAKLYYQNKQPIKAVAYLNKVKQLLPQKPEIYYYQGLISYDVEDTLRTVQCMQEALKIAPAYTDAYKYLFRLRQKLQQPYRALEVLKTAMEQPALRQDAELNEMYGDILLELKEKATAMNWYEKAIALDTTKWKAAYTLGKFHLEEKHYQLGVNYLLKASKTNPKIEDADYLLGLVYEYHLKDFVKAKQAYEKAVALQPTNAEKAELVKKMERKIAYEEYRKSPQYIIDLIKKRQDSISQANTPLTNSQ